MQAILWILFFLIIPVDYAANCIKFKGQLFTLNIQEISVQGILNLKKGKMSWMLPTSQLQHSSKKKIKKINNMHVTFHVVIVVF